MSSSVSASAPAHRSTGSSAVSGTPASAWTGTVSGVLKTAADVAP